MVTVIYSNAVAKYNEGRLLDAEKLRRLMDANFSDAVKMLCDYGYGGGNVDEKSYNVDSFISSQITSLIDYAYTDAPDEYITRILTNRFLYGNAKAYYKAKVSGKEPKGSIYESEHFAYLSGIPKGEYAALPQQLAYALTELDALFAESKPNPKTIDIKLTAAMYADSVAAAKKTRNKTLLKFVKSQIDLSNVLAALRARNLKLTKEAFTELIIDGGDVKSDDIIDIFSAEDPLPLIKDTEYEFLAEDEYLPKLEAVADDYLLKIWQPKAEDMLSAAPFINYFIAQLNEYKTVKTILTCIKNGVRAEIAPRLRGY